LEKLGKVVDSKVVQGVLIAIESVNMAMAVINYMDSFKKTSNFANDALANGIGSLLDLLSAIGETTKKVGKTPLSLMGTFSAAIDSGIAFHDSYSEYKGKDYDAMISKIVAGSGAATIAVGSALVTAAACSGALATCQGASAIVIVQSLFGYGAGLTASGVGSPVGGALIFIGAAVFAAGTIAYFFSNDSKTEEWVKESEWGPNPLWKFETSDSITEYLDQLHTVLYSFKAEVWYDPWSNRAGIRAKSPFFQAETKIIIHTMVLKGGSKAEKVIDTPLIIDESGNSGRKVTIEVKNGPEIDLVATIYHKTQLRDRDQCEAELFIDLFGNNRVILPTRKKPVLSSARIYG
jgi:hypothetical protein